MSVLINLLANVWLLLVNGYRSLRGAPEYVTIQISGSLPEFTPQRGLLQRFGPLRSQTRAQPTSLQEIRGRLRRVSRDGRVRGVMLRVQELDAGWAALEELRRELAAFRERGGRTVAYLIEPDTRSYYLACAADEILTTPLSTVSVVGVGTRVNFLKDALQRVGAEAEVIAVSPYKSAGDTFTRNDFSRESREQAERLVDRRFEEVISAIAEGRSISPERARRLVDGAPYSAPGAVEAGLTDGAVYDDELPERLGGGERARVAEWEKAQKSLRRPYRKLRRGRRVGVVSLSGVISRGKSRRLPVPLPFVGGEQAGSDSVVGALRRAEGDRSLAAVLFCVGSRGGDALASDLIWREVERIRRKKPVVVLMGEYAASGGYYVSAAADRIIARSNTTTGSIGVIITRPVLAGLYEKAGINRVSVERGARAGLLDPARRPDEDEVSVLREQILGIYESFKDRVARGRSTSAEEIEQIAGGRVWTGAEALQRGLVDEIGGFEDALGHARTLAGLRDSAGWIRVTPPGSSRPGPGENTAEGLAGAALAEVAKTASDLKATRTWTMLPYELKEER